MESRQKERVYEEFDPKIEWERDSPADTLKVYLPGFRKEQMKVHVTTARFLRISGESELGDNRVIKFGKEIPIPPNYDTNQISAKFERGILYIKHPKTITSDQKQPPKEAPKPPQPKPQSPPKIESPKPKLPETEPDKAKTPSERKDETPSKAEEKKDDASKKDQTANVGADKKQEILAGDSDSVGADNVGSGGKVAAGVQKYNYRQGLNDAVKNPKQVMEWIIRTLLVVFFWLRDMIMKPVKYFKKSGN